ncbi:MAG: hypothetical protein RLZZ383_1529 [Pseudomonadota bacterium]|jgi:RNA polymerase sigma-70 factor (ECF subfamily)
MDASWLLPLTAALVGLVGMVVSAPMETDEDVIAAVRSGDGEAYRLLVERYQDRIYQLIFGMVRHREDARELTQEAFVKAYRSLDGFREDARFSTWLYRIANNLVIDFCRRRGKGPVLGVEDDVAQRDPAPTSTGSAHVQIPSKALERQQLHAAILGALDALPEEHRQVVLLRELEGMSYREIAEIVGVAEGTVMSRLFYARKKLQALLAEHRHGLGGAT